MIVFCYWFTTFGPLLHSKSKVCCVKNFCLLETVLQINKRSGVPSVPWIYLLKLRKPICGSPPVFDRRQNMPRTYFFDGKEAVADSSLSYGTRQGLDTSTYPGVPARHPVWMNHVAKHPSAIAFFRSKRMSRTYLNFYQLQRINRRMVREM